MSNLFYSPITIDKLNFIQVRGDPTIFLKKGLCENVPRQHHRALYHFSPAYVADGLCIQQPNAEFIAWAEDLGIEFFVQQLWPDGCEIGFMNAREENMALMKLRWDSSLLNV